MRNNNRYYDDEFKASAVKMVVEKGRTITDVAKDLGVSQPSLRRWIRENSKPDDPTTKRLMELEVENRKLKKELKNANDTVEILKKSVAIFVKPQK
jgi:transposase